MKVNALIVGPGSLGSLLAAHIQKICSVWVYAHRCDLTLPTQWISLDGAEREPLHWQIYTPSSGAVDIVWLCAKAFHVTEQLPELVAQFPHALFVHLHNGMGPQQLGATLAPGRVVWGSTTCGALRERLGENAGDAYAVRHTGAGVTQIGVSGVVSAQQAEILDVLQHSNGPMNFERSEDMTSALWRKLAVNAVINPLTAVYQVRNGELLQDKYRAEINTLCAEIKRIAHAEGETLEDDLAARVLHVAKNTAGNRSSMAEDVRLRRRTEIEEICGFLLGRARVHGLSLEAVGRWYGRVCRLTADQ